jgi:hypothetical protein
MTSSGSMAGGHHCGPAVRIGTVQHSGDRQQRHRSSPHRQHGERIQREHIENTITVESGGADTRPRREYRSIQENTSVLTAGMAPTTARCQSDRWVRDVCSAKRGRIRRDHTGEIPPQQQRRDRGRREYAQESRDHRKNTQHSGLTTAVHQWSPTDRIATTFRHGERRGMAADPPCIP